MSFLRQNLSRPREAIALNRSYPDARPSKSFWTFRGSGEVGSGTEKLKVFLAESLFGSVGFDFFNGLFHDAFDFRGKPGDIIHARAESGFFDDFFNLAHDDVCIGHALHPFLMCDEFMTNFITKLNNLQYEKFLVKCFGIGRML